MATKAGCCTRGLFLIAGIMIYPSLCLASGHDLFRLLDSTKFEYVVPLAFLSIIIGVSSKINPYVVDLQPRGLFIYRKQINRILVILSVLIWASIPWFAFLKNALETNEQIPLAAKIFIGFWCGAPILGALVEAFQPGMQFMMDGTIKRGFLSQCNISDIAEFELKYEGSKQNSGTRRIQMITHEGKRMTLANGLYGKSLTRIVEAISDYTSLPVRGYKKNTGTGHATDKFM